MFTNEIQHEHNSNQKSTFILILELVLIERKRKLKNSPTDCKQIYSLQDSRVLEATSAINLNIGPK